ncbi:MAG: FAD-dependent oxidoreductase [Thermodesulfobacteriota bacterium]
MQNEYTVITGKVQGDRLESRVLEETIQRAVADGKRRLLIQAYGQHGLGGRLWKAGTDPVHVRIEGQAGQRVGSFGFPNTMIDVMGPASDDVGWLNAGAEIVVHGHAGNGLANAMAQGKIFVAGNIGARGMTMTKRNPRFEPPQVWVLGSVGDYFGEFMAGGVAVICGVNPQDPNNILGHRPFVGMVGGQVFFRGPHAGFSQSDARLIAISDEDWAWLTENLKQFLARIHRSELFWELGIRESWQLLRARSPQERGAAQRRSMASFRKDIWDAELGAGGLIGDLVTNDRSPIPLITTGDMRRFIPVWENRTYLAPCEASCPTGIPIHERWRLIREGRVDEAVDLALAYTPFPATVCGYLCPNPCMQACTRQIAGMMPVDTTQIGKASVKAGLPEMPELSGRRIAVVGGGPAGISIAWQLRRGGHEAVVYDMSSVLGGKISHLIPETRIPKDVLAAELDRVRKVIPHVHLQQRLSREETERLKQDFDYLVLAAGARKARTLSVPGKEKLVTAQDFLAAAKENRIKPGQRVVVIGAGNVGCDVATEAHRLGATDLLLIDVQEPASFGKERREAEAAGAVFRWPCFTQEILDQGVLLTTGEVLPADLVVISIGDIPDLDFLPESVDTERGYVKVDDRFQTSDPKIFAVGDIVKPGLLTDAIGAGRKAAAVIDALLSGREAAIAAGSVIDRGRISLEYFDPRITDLESPEKCGSQCASCGNCRDCGICVSICPQGAIRRTDKGGGEYAYEVDGDKCIGCGFCAGACPCGVWGLTANEPIG